MFEEGKLRATTALRRSSLQRSAKLKVSAITKRAANPLLVAIVSSIFLLSFGSLTDARASSWDSSTFGQDMDTVALATKRDPAYALLMNDNTTADGQGIVALKRAMALEAMFVQWSSANGRQYPDGAKRQLARTNFEKNMVKLYKVNADPSIPIALDCNSFCDVGDEEFATHYLMTPRTPTDRRPPHSAAPPPTYPNLVLPADLGRRGGLRPSYPSPPAHHSRPVPPMANDGGHHGDESGPHHHDRRQLITFDVSTVAPPPAVDWRTSGYLPPIRNQGKCGCCWAFAGNAVVEIAYTMLYGTSIAPTLSLSHQQIVSCANVAYGYYSTGCQGGFIDEAISYSSQVNGQNLTTTAIYPYTSRTTGITGVCNSSILSKTGPGDVAQIASTGVVYVLPPPLGFTAEAVLMRAVAAAPVAVYMYVGSKFKLYKSGIYDPSLDCSPTSDTINHGIVLVGYDTTSSIPYWIVRNSWGNWGMYGYGYIRMTGTSWPYGPCGMYQRAYQAYAGANFTKVLSAVNAG